MIALLPREKRVPILTPREESVKRLIGRGMTDKEIASELGLTVGTIKVYTTRIYRKLGLTHAGNARVRIALDAQASAYE